MITRIKNSKAVISSKINVKIRLVTLTTETSVKTSICKTNTAKSKKNMMKTTMNTVKRMITLNKISNTTIIKSDLNGSRTKIPFHRGKSHRRHPTRQRTKRLTHRNPRLRDLHLFQKVPTNQSSLFISLKNWKLRVKLLPSRV